MDSEGSIETIQISIPGQDFIFTFNDENINKLGEVVYSDKIS